MDRLTLRRVDHVHALTDAVATEARDVLGFPAERITTIPRGRSAVAMGAQSTERRARMRGHLGLSPQDFVFVNVGRQEPPKGQSFLVQVFAAILERVPDGVLVIAGREGTATPQLERSIAESGARDRIRTLGYRNDVADVLAAGDVFVFPSFYEGLGSALIEAMAIVMPIVASDIPAVREVLADGDAGVLCPIGDKAAWADALVTLAVDSQRRNDLGLAGYQRFRDHYDLDYVVDRTVDLYRRLGERR